MGGFNKNYGISMRVVFNFDQPIITEDDVKGFTFSCIPTFASNDFYDATIFYHSFIVNKGSLSKVDSHV